MSESGDNGSVHCWVYRSPKQQEMYLYLVKKDDFDGLPEALSKRFGTPEFVMELDLDENRKLARADISQVLANLDEQGFHLQMPPSQAELHERAGDVNWGN